MGELAKCFGGDFGPIWANWLSVLGVDLGSFWAIWLSVLEAIRGYFGLFG